MEVSRIRALRGPNLWTRHTAIEAIVRCEDDSGRLTRRSSSVCATSFRRSTRLKTRKSGKPLPWPMRWKSSRSGCRPKLAVP